MCMYSCAYSCMDPVRLVSNGPSSRPCLSGARCSSMSSNHATPPPPLPLPLSVVSSFLGSCTVVSHGAFLPSMPLICSVCRHVEFPPSLPSLVHFLLLPRVLCCCSAMGLSSLQRPSHARFSALPVFQLGYHRFPYLVRNFLPPRSLCCRSAMRPSPLPCLSHARFPALYFS